MKVVLEPVTTPEQAQWLRVQRNDPEQYKYFRQDRPIGEREQLLWWKFLDRTRVRLFIVKDVTNKQVGYAGFNPYDAYGCKAEFGIFIIKGCQGRGLGRAAMLELLEYGFDRCGLSTIYSDCLQYPGEDRFAFYQKLGFVAHPPPSQTLRYKKQGLMIPSLKFYMTKDMYKERYGRKADSGQLGAGNEEALAGAGEQQARGRKGPRLHSSSHDLHSAT